MILDYTSRSTHEKGNRRPELIILNYTLRDTHEEGQTRLEFIMIEEALASFYKGLIIRIRVLGHFHPQKTASKRNIAAVHSATNRRISRRIFQFGNPLVSSFV